MRPTRLPSSSLSSRQKLASSLYHDQTSLRWPRSEIHLPGCSLPLSELSWEHATLSLANNRCSVCLISQTVLHARGREPARPRNRTALLGFLVLAKHHGPPLTRESFSLQKGNQAPSHELLPLIHPPRAFLMPLTNIRC